MRILSVDVGSTNLGISILSFMNEESPNVLFCEYLKLPEQLFSKKLVYLFEYFSELVSKYLVTDISYEAPFFGKSYKGNELVMVCGILTLIAGQEDLNIQGYTASTVKKTAAGKGNADKKEVEQAIRSYFSFDSNVEFESGRHSSDAIAIGLTYFLKNK